MSERNRRNDKGGAGLRPADVRIGVYVCHCGSNIDAVVDCKAVARYAATLPRVVVARDYKSMCSQPCRDLLLKNIRDHKLNGIVVAACSPRLREPAFRLAAANGGLSPVFLDIVNIRGCESLDANRDPATARAKDLVRTAVRRVALRKPLGRACPRESVQENEVLEETEGVLSYA